MRIRSLPSLPARSEKKPPKGAAWVRFLHEVVLADAGRTHVSTCRAGVATVRRRPFRSRQCRLSTKSALAIWRMCSVPCVRLNTRIWPMASSWLMLLTQAPELVLEVGCAQDEFRNMRLLPMNMDQADPGETGWHEWTKIGWRVRAAVGLGQRQGPAAQVRRRRGSGCARRPGQPGQGCCQVVRHALVPVLLPKQSGGGDAPGVLKVSGPSRA